MVSETCLMASSSDGKEVSGSSGKGQSLTQSLKGITKCNMFQERQIVPYIHWCNGFQESLR